LCGAESVKDCVDRCHDPYWEPTLFNLGHAYRKTRQFDLALGCFERCVALCPDKFSPYSAVGFTKHLMGDLDGAIVHYHQALGCKADDPFSTEMLNRALRSALNSGLMLEGIGDGVGDCKSELVEKPTQWTDGVWSSREESAVDEAMDDSDDIMMSP
jgi:tetratricopeptide (TPR) repeat protein